MNRIDGMGNDGDVQFVWRAFGMSGGDRRTSGRFAARLRFYQGGV
jgi:hypothetical protein